MDKGQRIKQLRKLKKISQADLAEMLGTSKQNVYKYESGIITNIPSDKIELMAQIFNVSPCYIMGWDTSLDERRTVVDKVYSLPEKKFKKLKALLDIVLED